MNFARSLRSQVNRDKGIPIFIGIAATKTLAKLANRLAKKQAGRDGVFDLLTEPDIDAVLDSVEVGDIWGIGRQSATRLEG